MLFIGNGLVILGIIILAFALLPVRGLFVQLPAGSVRSQWKILTVLILFFIAGYIGYSVLYWNESDKIYDLVVPAIFVCGAFFVFIVCSLSLKTARDIMEIFTLQQESITDPLLGIFNRRHLDRQLKKETLRAIRYALPLSIFLVDIDHFKKINDTYGHQVGDSVLKGVSQLLISSLRATDIVARYGGDEFLGILPNTSCSSAYDLVERLRMNIEDHEIKLPYDKAGDQLLMRVTISCGVACLNEATLDEKALMKNVDKALYQAKNSGRNIVITKEDEAIN